MASPADRPPDRTIATIVSQARAHARDHHFYAEGVKYLTHHARHKPESSVTASEDSAKHVFCSTNHSSPEDIKGEQLDGSSHTKVPNSETGAVSGSQQRPFPSTLIAKVTPILDIIGRKVQRLSDNSKKESMAELKASIHNSILSLDSFADSEIELVSMRHKLRALAAGASQEGTYSKRKALHNVIEAVAEIDFLLARFQELQTLRTSEMRVVLDFLVRRLVEIAET